MISKEYSKAAASFIQAYTCQGVPYESLTEAVQLTLAANADDVVTMFVDRQYDIYVNMISFLTSLTNAPNTWFVNAHNICYEFIDGTSRKSYQNTILAAFAMQGTCRRPMKLAFPLLFNSTQRVDIRVYNYDIVPLNVEVKLHGTKVYKESQYQAENNQIGR